MGLLFWMGHTPDFQPIPAGFPRCGVFPPATDPPVAVTQGPGPLGDTRPQLDVLHLAWIVPVTFLLALLVGLLLGCCCRKRNASDNAVGTAEYSAQSGSVAVQSAHVST